MSEVASDLHVTTRTLRRHLLGEGTSFAELRDEVRQTLAEELLSRPRLSVEQIAERLGYAEATSFVNAVQMLARWDPAQLSVGEPLSVAERKLST